MKLFYIFYIANQFMDSDAFSMRSFARNSRKRIPKWLENGHFNGHFNDHRHKKSVRDSHSKVGDSRIARYLDIGPMSMQNYIQPLSKFHFSLALSNCTLIQHNGRFKRRGIDCGKNENGLYEILTGNK